MRKAKVVRNMLAIAVTTAVMIKRGTCMVNDVPLTAAKNMSRGAHEQPNNTLLVCVVK
jgi:hypothetical protein